MTEGNEAVNEMKQLEGMCAAVPPPDEDTLARARVRVLSVAGDTASGGTGRRRLALRGLGRGGLAHRRLITVPRLAMTSGLRGAGVLAAGLGLAAAVTAVAVVVASGAAGPAARSNSPAVQLSGRQILLAAATAAAARPAGSGTYWYVKTSWSAFGYKDSEEVWTRLDGQTWLRGGKTYGKLINEASIQVTPTNPARFDVAGHRDLEQLEGLPPIQQKSNPSAGFAAAGEATLKQLQKLPASPADLKAWIVALNRNFRIATGDPVPEREAVFESLLDLVSGVPAPPAVRAAAFRVMASLPGVTSLGPVSGGQGLRISLSGKQYATLVVDPATSQVRGPLTFSNGNSVSVIAEWTSQLP
jgi:hypothetical protein